MNLRLILSILLSLLLAGCIGGESTPNNTQLANESAKNQSKSYEIQLTGDWIKDAKVVDSNNQQATYQGKGIYAFSNEPKGTITLTGGTFEKTGLANKMALRADASSKTLSPLNSFLHDNPKLKRKVLNALNNQDGGSNNAAQSRASKIIYLMASNNLLNQFSNSLGNVKSYNDIVTSARTASTQSQNANSINIALLMISLSFFDVANTEHIEKIDGIAPTVSISPTNGSKIGSASNKKPTFTITFSEEVKNANNANIILTKAGGSLVALTITNSGNTYTATPNTDLESSASYTLTLKPGITDNAGNALTGRTINYKVAGTKRYVTETGSGSKEGTSWANAYEGAKLQQAINDVAADTDKGDVWVAKGVYKPSTADASVSFELKSGVKLYGGFKGGETNLEQRNFATNKTILSGDIDNNDSHKVDGITQLYRDINGTNSHTIIKLADANSTNTRMDGFYITGGKSTNASIAAGLNITNSTINLENVHFIGNLNFGPNATGSPTKGGAIKAKGSTLSIKNATFTRNAARYGAAIYTEKSTSKQSNLYIDRVKFIKNTSRHGGAIYNDQNKSTVIKNSYFENNLAHQNGGAIYNSKSKTQMTNVAFKNNTAFYRGGAVYNDNSSNILKSCNFSGNSTHGSHINDSNAGIKGQGGAIYNLNASNSTITNSTFSYNTSHPEQNSLVNEGGAIYNSNSAPTIINSTFYNNHANKGGAMYTENNAVKKPAFVNSLLLNNEDKSDTEKKQYDQAAGTNNQAYKSSDSYIKTSGATEPQLVEQIIKMNDFIPHHIYKFKAYDLTNNALAVGNHNVNDITISVPENDEIGNQRPFSSVYKGAIQTVDSAGVLAKSKPFIKVVTPLKLVYGGQTNNNTFIFTVTFSEPINPDTMATNTIKVTKKNKTSGVLSPVTVNTISPNSSNTQYRIKFNADPEQPWHTLTITTGVKSQSSGAPLNRKYAYEFKSSI